MNTVQDFEDLLELLERHEVRNLIIGGLAFIYHAKPRFTKGMDLWIGPDPEYLVVATRPAEVNGLGLSPEDALFNAASIRERLQILAEDEATLRRVERIVRDYGCRGKQIHDAHIVATALEHGIARLVTENKGDFVRYGDLLEIVDLGATDR